MKNTNETNLSCGGDPSPVPSVSKNDYFSNRREKNLLENNHNKKTSNRQAITHYKRKSSIVNETFVL